MAIGAAMVGAAVVGAVGSAVGSSMTNSANAKMADKANQQAQQNADTAHQREVADLRAAGLNPILSAGGNGAAVPAYSVPEMQNPLSGLADALSKGITNATAWEGTRQIDPMIDKTRSEAKLNNALTLKAAADTTSALSLARRNEAETLTSASYRSRADAETQSIKSSPFVSKFLGSDSTSNLSSFISNTSDTVASKMKDIISNIHVSSAKKVSPSTASRPTAKPSFRVRVDERGFEHFIPQ